MDEEIDPAKSVLLSHDFSGVLCCDANEDKDCWESHFDRAAESTGQLSISGGEGRAPNNELHLERVDESTGHEDLSLGSVVSGMVLAC